jgi:hypothetical protein
MKARALLAFVTLAVIASQLGTVVWGNGIIWGS